GGAVILGAAGRVHVREREPILRAHGIPRGLANAAARRGLPTRELVDLRPRVADRTERGRGAPRREHRQGQDDRAAAHATLSSFGAATAARGSRTVKQLPSPSALSTVTLPSWASTSSLTIASPSPEPCRAWWAWRYGSKITGSLALGMPSSLSRTVTS